MKNLVSETVNKYIRKTQEELHRIPEPAFQEFKTASYIENQLKTMGYEVRKGIAGTGITATIKGVTAHPCVAVRADMDCITHEQQGETIYRHSCGHDAHSSIALGIAKFFSENQKEFNGSIKFIFQPAEEIGQGAKAMTAEGVLDDVDYLIGYHLRTAHECPNGSMSPALIHSAATIVTGEIKGTPSHGGRPHLGVNVIDVMTTLLSAVNAIRVNPQSGTNLKFTKLSAGGGSLNVIPGSGSFALDVRSQDNEDLKSTLAKLEGIFQHTAIMHDAKISYHIRDGVPAPRYSDRLIDETNAAIIDELGEGKAIPPITTPGGEDFHYYTELTDVEAVYFAIGADVSPGLHDPNMTFNQGSLVDGASVAINLIQRLLSNK